MKKAVSLLAILFLSSFLLKAQAPGQTFFSRLYFGQTLPDQMIYFSIDSGMSGIVNANVSEVTDWSKREQFGFGFDAGYIKRIRPLFSVGGGLGIQRYGMDIHAKSDFLRIIEGQIDNSDPVSFEYHNQYDALITYENISQQTTLTFLNIPIFIMFSNISYDKWGFFIKTGLAVSFPLSDTFQADGYYTQEGKYGAFGGLILPDIPGLYAFSEDLYTGAKHYEIKSLGLSGMISFGITLPLSGLDGLIISLGPTYNRSIISVAEAGGSSNTDYHNDFNYLLEANGGGATTRLWGIQLQLSYGIGRLIY